MIRVRKESCYTLRKRMFNNFYLKLIRHTQIALSFEFKQIKNGQRFYYEYHD